MRYAGDYEGDMAEEHVRDELLDYLAATAASSDSLSPMSEALGQLRSLGRAPLDDGIVARHLDMITNEAANTPAGAPFPRSSAGPLVPRRRRRLVAVSYGLRLVGAVVALALLGGGTALAADGAVPGEALYGIDRFAESIGLDDGGVAERVDEARTLVERGDHSRAVKVVEEAVEDLADDSTDPASIQALQRAAAQIMETRTTSASGYQDTQVFRDQVATLLSVIAEEAENGSVDGARIAETARGFSQTARDFAAARGNDDESDPPPGLDQGGPGRGVETPGRGETGPPAPPPGRTP